ncbi:RmlC-like cupin domain-containing protein [Kockiozyma suomiensis]|uniref:RmlC-like cupin domain-containing protein n=1 Tax=Kockiozyma suomiensis TaxID=1337062 RepID=UPI003342FB38
MSTVVTQSSTATATRTSSADVFHSRGEGGSEETPHDEYQNLLASLPEANVRALWTFMSDASPPVPNPRAIPFVWSYQESLRPRIMEAGRLVPAELAERRVLLLNNPGIVAAGMFGITDTLFSGIQLVNPGETAPAHRHTAFALRYIIEGNKGFTDVEGDKLYMCEGDVILTPNWKWHDHGNEGDRPMVWLDGLDLPIWQRVPVNFTEEYEHPRYPAEDTDTSEYLFRWTEVTKDLDSQPTSYATHNYTKYDGSELSAVVGADAYRIDENTWSPLRLETTCFVFHVYKGTGYTLVGKGIKQVKLEWKSKDVFCIPAYTQFKSFATSNSYLFSFCDRPLLQKLEAHRIFEVKDEE